MKIMIVDDDLINCQLLRQILKPFGETEIAMDGEEAFRLFQEAHSADHPFAVIFLDIMMPKLDGRQLLKMIRAWESENIPYGLNEVKIVMVSAYDSKENILSSFKDGCEYFLVKPITQSKVREIMTEMGC
jgi:two-component system, chemotaxis family, chemotaxis protein CheY